MIAKYDGVCKVTGEKIIAGETELVKVNGAWQIKPLVTVSKAGNCPPSKARHTFTYKGYTVYAYLYIGQYGHWKIWKIDGPNGEEVDLCQKYLGFVNTGSGFRNPVGSTAANTESAVKWSIDYMLDTDGVRTKFEAEEARRDALGIIG